MNPVLQHLGVTHPVMPTATEPGGIKPTRAYLTCEEVAERYRCSVRSIHEATRLREIPHFVRPGSRRCLFRDDWLERWEDGAALEVVEQGRGGRIVRPLQETPDARPTRRRAPHRGVAQGR